MPKPSAEPASSTVGSAAGEVSGSPATSRRASRQAQRAAQRHRAGWSVVGVLGEVLISLGVFLLLFVAWQLWWTDVEANRASSSTVATLRETFQSQDLPDPMAEGGLIEGKAFALLYVPRFGEDWVQPIMEGTGLDILTGGLGHYTDTALPGAVGNFSVAGHRTTWGRPLHEIETLVEGDKIVVQTRDSWEVYAVSSHQIVAPTQVDVIDPVPGEPGVAPTDKLLTLTTCHPKYSAEQRYIVHATWVESHSQAEGLPASVLKSPGGK